jgi:hypothetical protein
MMILDSYRFGDGSSGFRYLHDEISGGIIGVSHLKVKSAYAGNSITVDSVDYGYVSNVVPLSDIQTANPTDATIEWYDAVNSYDISSVNGFSGGVDFQSASGDTGAAGFSINLTDAKCIVWVVRMDSAGSGLTQGIWTISNSTTIHQTTVFAGSNNLFLRKRNGTNATSQFSGVRSTGVHLYMWNDDGSVNASGDTLYYDDMTTAVTLTSASGTTTNAALTSSIGLHQWGSNTTAIDGSILDYHVFDHELTLSERETVKEILEQYYTF